MMTNKELIEKATITTDAIASAGKLNPLQADKFIDYVFDETGLSKAGIRLEKFDNEQMELDKIDVAQRVAVPFEEAKDPQVRRGVTTSTITLAPKGVMVPFEISDLFKQRNIEKDKVEDHIIKMMATRAANNAEEMYFDGNLLGPARDEDYMRGTGNTSQYVKDSLLGLFDGLLKIAESGNIVDAANAPISPNLVSRALRAIPNRFRKDRKLLKAFLSWDHEQHYREAISGRGTAVGDAALTGEGNMPSFGVELMPMSLLDSEPIYVENSVANTDGTTATSLTHAPIANLVLTPTTLGKTPTTPYVEGVDYTVNASAGTWTRLAAGAISSGATIKATYTTAGKMIVTNPQNIIVAIGRDVSIESDRDIYGRVTEFAMHMQIFVAVEEVQALSYVRNIQVPS